MNSNRILVLFFTTVQVLGFSLLWYKLPNSVEQNLTPDQFSISAMKKLEQTKKRQPSPITDNNLAMVRQSIDNDSFRSSIREILKEELAIALENQTMITQAVYTRSQQSTPKEQQPLTAEQAQQRQTSMIASRSIIEQAISEGEWNNEDVTAITPYVDNLSNAQREELIQLYLQGVGEKAMSEGVPPPPL